MLAEIFMIRLEATTRLSNELTTLDNPRFVPFDRAALPSLKDIRYPHANLTDPSREVFDGKQVSR